MSCDKRCFDPDLTEEEQDEYDCFTCDGRDDGGFRFKVEQKQEQQAEADNGK